MPGPVFAAGSLTYISDLNALSNAILTFSPGQTVNFTGVRGFWYGLEANNLQITAPISPSIGDLMRFSGKGSSITSFTLLRNGNNIDSTAADYTVSWSSDRDLNVWFIYWSASVGWRPIRGDIGGLTWGGVQSAGFTAAKNTHYGLNGGAYNILMPASPAPLDMVRFTTVDATVTPIQFQRNGSNINSGASDYTTLAKSWDLLAIYLDATRGWVFLFTPTLFPAVRYDGTITELRYHNSQRELSDAVGWLPYALPLGLGGQESMTVSSVTLPVSGGAIAIPFHLAGHLLLDGFSYLNKDASGAHTLEWRVYKQQLNAGNAGEATVTEVSGANGTFTFTPGAAGQQNSSATGAPVYMPPGEYWLVLRNTSASVTAAIEAASVGTLTLKVYQTKTLGVALASTLDLVTTWTISAATGQVGCKLNGRVLGGTSSTYQ